MRDRARYLALSFVALAALISPALGAAQRIRLPSAEQTVRARIRAEQLLRGGRGPERTLPGRVEDVEQVTVSVSPDGTPQRVIVDQRLHLRGVGDYFVKIPGPVRSATRLPDSTALPGVRSGSLVWQGFASDDELLGARVQLDPQIERRRLPLRVRLHATVDGEPVDFREPVAGVLKLTVIVANTTGSSVALPSGIPRAKEVAAALDALRAELDGGEQPRPGSRGIPDAISAKSVERKQSIVAAPLLARLRIALPSATSSFKSSGGTIERDEEAAIVTDSVVLSGGRLQHTFRMQARIPSGMPLVEITASPALPTASEAAPADAKTWKSAVRRADGEATEMLDRLVFVLQEVARLPDIDGYLGNPDRDGPTRTTYIYEIVPGPRPDAVQRPPRDEPPSNSIVGIALAGGLAILILVGLVLWWLVS